MNPQEAKDITQKIVALRLNIDTSTLSKNEIILTFAGQPSFIEALTKILETFKR